MAVSIPSQYAGRTLLHGRRQRLLRGGGVGLLGGGGGGRRGGADEDGGAAHGAGGVRSEPGVDAVGVERVRALGQPPQLLAGLHLREAHGAVERRPAGVRERGQRGDRGRAHAAVPLLFRRRAPGRGRMAAAAAATEEQAAAAAAADVPDGEVEEEREDADGEGEAHEEQPRAGAVARVVRGEEPRVGRAHAHLQPGGGGGGGGVSFAWRRVLASYPRWPGPGWPSALFLLCLVSEL
jgi:hypothetical protein